jgi:Family of unknown function (DUF5924)/Protein of unknown function (DUF2914)
MTVGALWRSLLARWPGLSWLATWGISFGSLVLGLSTLFVFRRGLPHVGWVAGYLLLLWLLFAALSELEGTLREQGRDRVVGAGAYAIQSLYHGVLLFVLPAYYAATTLGARNAFFLVAVAGGALLTAVDPWYRRLVGPRAWLGHALLAFSIFAALNVALPLVGLRPILALEMSAVLAVVALVPAFRRHGTVGWTRAFGRALIFAGLAAVLAWFGRGLVPPAPLFITRAVAARTVDLLEPVDVIDGSIPAATVAEWGELAAYTAVYAPGGLQQGIAHVWTRNGVVVARIPLSPVRGGRAEGFRTWSRRTDLRPPLAGRYRVDVVTASDQLIGRLRFTVTP